MRRSHPAELIEAINGARMAGARRSVALPVRRTSGAATHLAWAGGGFIVGAMCWHMVGFWGFVGQMLDETQRPSAAVVYATQNGASSGKTTARLLSNDGTGDCVRHIQAVATHESSVQPCALPLVALKDVSSQ